MWSWERERRRQAAEEEAQLGVVTLSGTVTAANLGGERRGLTLCAPGGLRWRPREGARVLVLKTEAGEEPCVLGTVEESDGLRPGELRLPEDVTVAGEPLRDYIRRIMADMNTEEE